MLHPIQIIAIPAFEDNYIWLMHNGTHAIVVDPGDATPVISTLKLLKLELDSILITHHHHDHIGGVTTLSAMYPDAQTYAPKNEQYAFKHQAVGEPDVISNKSLGIELAVLDLPGHTLGHIAYHINTEQQKWLFCGDTLFGAGCGRLFEGTAEQMFNSLQKLAALPTDTKVYCTHEYTLTNIAFAMTLEPNNQALAHRQQETIKLRNQHIPSLPSTIGLELATNPFLRCDSIEVKSTSQLENASDLQVFSKIRELRNLY